MPSGPAGLLRTTAMDAASKVQFGKLLGLLPTIRTAKLAGKSVDEWIDDHNLRPDAAAIVRTLVRLSTNTADSTAFSSGAAVRQLQI